MKKVLMGMAVMSCVALAGEGTNLYLSTGVDISGKFEEVTFSEGKRSEKLNRSHSESSGFELTAEVTKEVAPNLELGLGISYQDHDKPEASYVEKDTIKNTGYNSVPLYLIGKYNIPVESNIKPYLKADLGYSFNFGESDLKVEGNGAPMQINTSIDNGLYYGLGAGIEYNNFIVELMYKVNQADVEYKNSGVKYKKDYDYSRTTLAFGYRFDF